MRDRKHLVSAEVQKLIDAAKDSRNAARDRCFLLLMFRHGLRVSEACGLQLLIPLAQAVAARFLVAIARRITEGPPSLTRPSAKPPTWVVEGQE